MIPEEGKDRKGTGGTNVQGVNLFHIEAFDNPGKDKVLVVPNSEDRRLYEYLKSQAGRLHQQFAHTIKGCIHSATVLADGNFTDTSKVVMTERHGYLTMEAK